MAHTHPQIRDLERVLETVRAIARGVVAHDAEAVDRDARWPERGLRELREAGLGGLVLPRDYGGRGHGLMALAQVCEVLGEVCPSTALCFGMHAVGSSVMAANPTARQIEQFLIPIAQGRHMTTLALSEPGSGAHFYLPETRIEADGGKGFRVNGTKTFVTNGGHANSYVVSGVSGDGDVTPDRFSCIVVEADAAGLEWGAPWDGLGMRGNASRTVQLNSVPVPRTHLLGREGDQIWYVFHVVAPYFLIAMAGTYLGIAAAALDHGREHLIRRHYTHSGSSLSELPVLQHRMGKLWGNIERTRRLIYHAAASFDAGHHDALAAIMSSKAEVGDCAVEVVNEVMTMTGGVAYREGSRVHQHMRDVRAVHLMSPTTDILRLWVGRMLLDQPVLGD